MDAVAFALGVFLLTLVYWDLFETIVVPRPTPGWFRIGRYLVRGSWRAIRVLRDGRPERSYDRLLGLFAPAMTIALLGAWLSTLILGYGLVLFALRDELSPVPVDLGSALYFAATSILTLGFGDIVAVGAPARIIIITAAVSGLGAVALVVTFLFSLYGSYQRREIQVVALQAAAGAPPSAVALLETYAQLDLVGRLPDLFIEWEHWAVEVLDSHIAYPLLGFFRSSHDNLSWISALGTVLDASSLVLTTIVGVPRGEAKLVKRVGTHLVEDIFNLGFGAGESDGLDRAAFELACDRLEEAGYTLEAREKAWPAFEAARATYAARLEAMATYWATPATSWLGAPMVLRSPLHPQDDQYAPPRGRSPGTEP
jgi:Ion channel